MLAHLEETWMYKIQAELPIAITTPFEAVDGEQ